MRVSGRCQIPFICCGMMCKLVAYREIEPVVQTGNQVTCLGRAGEWRQSEQFWRQARKQWSSSESRASTAM